MKLAKPSECTGCMACVDACGHKVLDAQVDKDGYYKIIVNSPDACVECGLCTAACPVLKAPEKERRSSVPYAAWSSNADARKNGASGGLFGAMARSILNEGGVVYGAALDGFEVKHMRVETPEELHRLQGSKYQHSSMLGVYRQIRTDLIKGRKVLFGGVSCQVAGLLQFLGRVSRENLVTVDTVCGGLSTMLPMMHLRDSGQYSGIVSFRDKEHGWRSTGFRYALKMMRKDGTVENLGLDNAVLNTFSSKLLKRSSCLDCHFNGRHRAADCTIADFWGDKRFPAEHQGGLSALVVHTDRGERLVASSAIERKEVEWENIERGNHNLTFTSYPWIRKMPWRKSALKAQRRGDFAKAWRYMAPGTPEGMVLRLYLKLNDLRRKNR